MNLTEQTLIKHKDFITVVAKGLVSPNKDHDYVKEILAAYKDIDNTADILAECATCEFIYRNTFKLILAYCEDKNWFNELPIYYASVNDDTDLKIEITDSPIVPFIKVKAKKNV